VQDEVLGKLDLRNTVKSGDLDSYSAS